MPVIVPMLASVAMYDSVVIIAAVLRQVMALMAACDAPQKTSVVMMVLDEAHVKHSPVGEAWLRSRCE